MKIIGTFFEMAMVCLTISMLVIFSGLEKIVIVAHSLKNIMGNISYGVVSLIGLAIFWGIMGLLYFFKRCNLPLPKSWDCE